MIIGAGEFQLKGIEKALELGLDVIATDGNPNAPGLRLATRAEILDVRDIEGHVILAKSINLNAVLSIATDASLRTVVAVAKEKGLRSTSPDAIEISLNKKLQRELFMKSHLPSPRFSTARNMDEAKDAIKYVGIPAIIKPVDNSGSRGVGILENEGDLQDIFEKTMSFSEVKEVIIEEIIEGVECTVEGITIDGKHHILGISDKYKPDGHFRVATELCYPARLPEGTIMEIKYLMGKAYTAMGIDYAPTHSEVIVSKNGPVIIEVACRGGGFYVFTDVIEAVSGVDIVSVWIKTCLGKSPRFNRVLQRGVVLRFFAPSPGRLIGIKVEEKVNKIDGVTYGFFVKPGEIVPELASDGSRTGFIIARGDDSSDAIKKADFISNNIQFDIERL